MRRSVSRRSGAIEKASPPRGATTRDVAAMVRAMTQYSGDVDYSASGRPLPRPPEWMLSQFGPNHPLPNQPLDQPRPDSGQPDPRIYQYPVAWNLQYFNDRPVSWDVLKQAADSPLFRACIETRKLEIGALDWTWNVNSHAVEQVARTARKAPQEVANELRDTYHDEIERLNDFWSAPDRKNGYDFEAWIKLLFEEQLVWDALAIYPRRTYGGSVNDMIIIDGSTIKPLLDEMGGRPEPPAPAYQQILYGFPRGEFTADTIDVDGRPVVPNGYAATQLVYERRVRRTRNPYGFSPTEQALLHGMLYNSRFRWMLSEYTDGVMPRGYLVNKDPQATGWEPGQVLEYERAYNDRFAGQTAERMRAAIPPPGYEPSFAPETAERYKADYDLHLIKLAAMHFGITASELGFQETGNLGSSGYHEGQEDILYRKVRLPDIRYAARLITKMARAYMNAPPELEFTFLGLEEEDESSSDKVDADRVASGRMTVNESRSRMNLPPFGFAEADEPMLQTQRGVVFLRDSSQVAPAGTLIEPASEQGQEDKSTQPGTPAQNAAVTAHEPASQRAKTGNQGSSTIQAVKPKAAAKKEIEAFGRWAAKRGNPDRRFEFEHLTIELAAELAPELLSDNRAGFAKAGGAAPKASSPDSLSLNSSGQPGSKTLRWSPYSPQL